MRRSAYQLVLRASPVALAAFYGVFWFETAPPARAQNSSATSGATEGYIDSKVCAGCHASIWETYQRTGMGRSFYRPSAANQIEDYTKIYFHEPSATYYTMVQHDGKYFQRQYQIGFDGKPTNVSEAEIDLIVGSGNHSRTYLHRTVRNTLIELPLAWYAEKGGYWAMNPGYDRPDHQSRRRLIGYDCMFCHNAYPEIPADADRRSEPVFLNIKEGIDCQRCHGPGEKHVALARKPNTPRADIRSSIVNPARLARDRQAEVCLEAASGGEAILLVLPFAPIEASGPANGTKDHATLRFQANENADLFFPSFTCHGRRRWPQRAHQSIHHAVRVHSAVGVRVRAERHPIPRPRKSAFCFRQVR